MSIEYLKSLVIDMHPELDDMDYFLLVLTLTTHANQNSIELQDYFNNVYGRTNNQTLEFLGDRVLDLVIASYLFEKRMFNEGELTKIKQILVNNKSLYCLSERKGFCHIIPEPKACADFFEALIGALYLHLEQDNPIQFIKKWLIYHFKLNFLIDDILLYYPNIKTICDLSSIYLISSVTSSIIEYPE